MDTKRVIANKCLPARPQVFPMLTAWLLLDRYHAPGWVIGVVFTVLGLVFIGTWVQLFQQIEVDVLEVKK